jgi:hypothetical protein
MHAEADSTEFAVTFLYTKVYDNIFILSPSLLAFFPSYFTVLVMILDLNYEFCCFQGKIQVQRPGSHTFMDVGFVIGFLLHNAIRCKCSMLKEERHNVSAMGEKYVVLQEIYF